MNTRIIGRDGDCRMFELADDGASVSRWIDRRALAEHVQANTHVHYVVLPQTPLALTMLYGTLNQWRRKLEALPVTRSVVSA